MYTLLHLGAFGHIVPFGNTSHFVCTFTTGGCYEVHHCGITQTTHFIKDFTAIGSGTDVRQLKLQGIELKGQSKPLRFSKTLLTNWGLNVLTHYCWNSEKFRLELLDRFCMSSYYQLCLPYCSWQGCPYAQNMCEQRRCLEPMKIMPLIQSKTSQNYHNAKYHHPQQTKYLQTLLLKPIMMIYTCEYGHDMNQLATNPTMSYPSIAYMYCPKCHPHWLHL